MSGFSEEPMLPAVGEPAVLRAVARDSPKVKAQVRSPRVQASLALTLDTIVPVMFEVFQGDAVGGQRETGIVPGQRTTGAIEMQIPAPPRIEISRVRTARVSR